MKYVVATRVNACSAGIRCSFALWNNASSDYIIYVTDIECEIVGTSTSSDFGYRRTTSRGTSLNSVNIQAQNEEKSTVAPIIPGAIFDYLFTADPAFSANSLGQAFVPNTNQNPVPNMISNVPIEVPAQTGLAMICTLTTLLPQMDVSIRFED